MMSSVCCPCCGTKLDLCIDTTFYYTVNICCHGCYTCFLATPVPFEMPKPAKTGILYSFTEWGDYPCSISQEM